MPNQIVGPKDEGQDGLFIRVDPVYHIFQIIQREDGLMHDLILSFGETKELAGILTKLTSESEALLPEPQSNE